MKPMGTVPPDVLRTKRGNLNTAGIILMVIAAFSVLGWIGWTLVRN
jgi:hypothetical protein